MKMDGRILFVLMLFTIQSLPVHSEVTNKPIAQTIDTTRIAHDYFKKKQAGFHYPGKQFFFQGQATIGFAGIGCRLVAGYRLGQFGILGGGMGTDWLLGPLNRSVDPYNGVYFPIFAHYEGDILKKWVTPFYAVEAGYSFRYTNSSNNTYITVAPLLPTSQHPIYNYYGGFMGAIDFGAKFYVWHNVFVDLSATLDIQQAKDKYSNYYYNSIGQDIKLSYSSTTYIFVPGLKIACGF